MAVLTPSIAKSGGNFIPQLWTKEAQLARRNKVVAANLVQRQYESDLAVGDTVNVPFIANMTADTVTAGTDLVAVAPSETYVAVVVDTMKGKAVTLHDWTKKQSKYDLAKIYGGQIGEALARAIDTAVLTELATPTSGFGTANTAIDCGATATYANIVAAVTALDAANVPQEDRAFIVNAKFMGDLRQMAEFTRYDAVGQKNPSVATSSANNMVGSIYGIPVYMSNNVITIAGTPAKDQNILLHKDAVALVVQSDVSFEQDRRSLALSTDVVGSCLFGVRTLRKDHVVVLKHN